MAGETSGAHIVRSFVRKGLRRGSAAELDEYVLDTPMSCRPPRPWIPSGSRPTSGAVVSIHVKGRGVDRTTLGMSQSGQGLAH